MGAIADAVAREIAVLEDSVPGLGDRTEAALALNLAARIDDPGTSTTAAALATSRLLDVLTALEIAAASMRASERPHGLPQERDPLRDILVARDAAVARLSAAEDRAAAGGGGSS